MAWLTVVGLVVLARLPSTIQRGVERGAELVPAVQRGLSEPAPARIARTTAITPDLVAAIRAAMPADGRLVLYSPYGGTEFEFLLRAQFERLKNLLYPLPRDVHFARAAAELRGKITAGSEGRLLVLDGTQEASELSIGGTYELVHTVAIGTAGRLRLWRLTRAQ